MVTPLDDSNYSSVLSDRNLAAVTALGLFAVSTEAKVCHRLD